MMGEEQTMKIETQKVNNVTVVVVEGEIDTLTVPQLHETFDRLVAAGEQNYVIDLAGVPFMDSSGLAALVKLFKRIRIGHGDVRLCRVRPEIRKILELTRLDRVFEIYEDRTSAVESYREQG
ncbi:MAG: anti-sigma factor antagonist [Chloroflexi bacterium]|nr:MAG: anti-sigma factor antagonist [Chloroflexota bacterium]